MKRDRSRLGLLASALLACAILFTAACTGSPDGGGDTALRADTLTRRQKDSIVSTLPIPGAGAVGRALNASDLAAERALAHDTLY